MSFVILLFCVAILSSVSHAVEAGDRLSAVGAGAADVRLTGPFGERLDRMVCNHVERTDAVHLAEVFHGRTREAWWQTEFWGKYMHSAVPFFQRTGSAKLRANAAAGVERVLAAQEPCGYIGNYAEDVRCGGWDVWGMKYTMLGLLHYYDGTRSGAVADVKRGNRALAACRRLCDYVIGELGPQGRRGRRLCKTGGWGGLPSCSILEPVVGLYRRTRDGRYLAFADEIVRQAGEDPDGPRLLVQADVPVADRRLAALPREWTPARWYVFRGLTKAYEMMSCYQGLIDYGEVTGKRECLAAAVRTAESIVRDEINLAGGGAAREMWFHGAEQQHRPYAWSQETCVITTWMRLCGRLLAATDDPKWADQLEKTFYNVYLAALNRAGDHFASYTPLAGYRGLGHCHCGMHTDCCNANGPRGYLALLDAFASATNDVLTVDFYVSGDVRARLGGAAEETHFEMHTFYPKLETAELWYRSRTAQTFTLRLRIPSFSTHTKISVNGQSVTDPVTAGTRFELRRAWQPGDKVSIRFDMPVAMHRLGDAVAFTRGPVCLARDTRFGDGALDEEVRAGEVTPEVLKAFAVVRPPTTDMFLAVAAPLPCGSHTENAEAGNLPASVHFTDFASAGNTWQPNDRYRVWLPVLLNIQDEPVAHAPVAHDRRFLHTERSK